MEKKPEENNSNAIESYSNEEFLTQEDYGASFTLASLMHAKLDEKSAVTLEKLKRKILRAIKGKEKQEKEDPCIEENPSSVIHGSNRISVPNSTIFLDDYRPPDFPPIKALAGLIGECSKPCEKRLTQTDLKDSQTRLSLNKKHVQESMIPLLKEDEDVNEGIRVITYDIEGKEYVMKFVFWSLKMYVLTSAGWKTFYREHRLEKDIDIVTVWMFRHSLTQNLCFVISPRRSPMASPTQSNNRRKLKRK
ncbi:B3 domain-containing protein At1g20600-like [Durio zibethinus]|uniref:B3 domain-containing protein At1g20600-like n=1 Tax=Durio zibethinus TaxID=66656 RepID=A0A6P5WPB5_DURZI|nr:B3 domain-containing protein At1g20600-like [Durio zibethinus]